MKNRNAFTLVELVVVTAIICVLFAILAPVLSLARRQARSAACINNLMQIGFAISQYRADHDDRVPTSLGRAPELASGGGLFQSAWATDPDLSEQASSLSRYYRSSQIALCPEVGVPTATSYGLNGRVIDAIEHFSQIPSPTSTPLVFDGKLDVGYYYADLDNRHVGHSNILYADMHVEPRYFDVLFDFPNTSSLPGIDRASVDLMVDSVDTDNTANTTNDYDITVRIAGTPWQSVAFSFLEGGTAVTSGIVYREPGAPNTQDLAIGQVSVDPYSNRYYVELTLDVEKHPGKGKPGANPVWLLINDKMHKLTTLNHRKLSATVEITDALVEAIER